MLTVNLSADEYSDFLRCISNFKGICNDVDIRNGIIRQRSNDLTSLFEMDLREIIQEANLPISNLEKKLDLLKIFVGQEVTFEIYDDAEDEKYFTLSDAFSLFRFKFPTMTFLDNKFISQDEMDRIYNTEEEDLILHNDLEPIITERIKITTINFNIPAIQIVFEGSEASVFASTQANDQSAKIKTGIPLNIELENCTSNLSTLPFCIDHDENMEFKMYKDPTQEVSMNKISTKLGSININVYSRSTLMRNDTE